MKNVFCPVFTLFIALLGCSLTSFAQDLKLNISFGDNMIFQREKPIPVYGIAPAATDVTVQLDKASQAVKSDDKGSWRVELPAMKAGGPYELTIKAADKAVTYKNVMIGDVWVCAGQSNMAYRLAGQPYASATIAKANHPNIRLFHGRAYSKRQPITDFSDRQQGWKVCTPDTVANFSGVGYHFAAKLQAATKVPIGIILAARGGTFIEAWTPKAALEATPELKPILDQWDWLEKNSDELKKSQQAKHKEWAKDNQARFNNWKVTRINGPFVPHCPGGVPSANGNLYPGNLYNASIHPHTLRPIKGVVWYQGESNSDRAYQYRDLLKLFVSSWRNAWKQPDLPFVFVQLPNYDYNSNPYDHQDGGPWEIVRESQATTADIPNTAMAVTLGFGMDHDVHPPQKRDVAARIANCALKLVYGKDIPAYAPSYQKHEIKGNAVLITFTNVEAGLVSLSGRDIVGFTIAGADKVFHPAKVEIIDKSTIKVSSKDVPSPQAVRHAWAGVPEFDLANSVGLPVSTFRTDTWEVPTQKNIKPFWWLSK